MGYHYGHTQLHQAADTNYQVSIHDQVIHMQLDDECARCDSSRKRIYLIAHLQLQIPYQHRKSCLRMLATLELL